MTDKKTVVCPWCEDGVYYDVLGSPCKYNFCPMCGRALASNVAPMKQVEQPKRTPIGLSDVKWLGVPYFAEYKGVERMFVYVTGAGMNADFAAARELGWKGKVLKEFWKWENQHGKLQVRLWEAKHSPPTDEERAAAHWEVADNEQA